MRQRAINLAHSKRKLMDVAQDLYRTQGWEVPAGFIDPARRDALAFSREEAGQGKRAARDPKALKVMFAECWQQSDSGAAFAAALWAEGYCLAHGDRRSFVAVDRDGNPFGAAVSVFDTASEDLIFALDIITHAWIEEPADGDSKNKYFRAWPRLMIEFAVIVMLSRNPRLCIPSGIAALLDDSDMLKDSATIEAEEGDAALKGLANSILGMVGHEHWFQHLEAAQSALRQFRPGTRLYGAGRGATVGHADLIRDGAFIFLVGPQRFMSQLAPYYALHLLSFLQAAYSGAGHVRIIADEFTNAPLKSLVEALTTLRGFGAEVYMIAQSRSEIERRFGRLGTLTIEENAIVKQWFGFSCFDEAERVSKAMGEELAVGSSLGADSETLRLNTNLNLVRQRWMSPAELMAMPADQQLVHIKGLGFFVAKKIGQQQIAPFCHLVAENPIEGGRLAPDPILSSP
jgi:type IV secretion system protein VirD4